MLPFSVTTEDGPIYVNPKQYHGILRRRKIRAKEGLQKRPAKDKVLPLISLRRNVGRVSWKLLS